MFPLFGAFFLWVGLSPWEDSEGFWSDLPIRLFGATLALAFVALPFRPRVELLPDRVVACGLVARRVIPLSELTTVRPGYAGLTLISSDGRAFTVTGVGEKSNLAALFGRTGRADRLRAAARRHQAPDVN